MAQVIARDYTHHIITQLWIYIRSITPYISVNLKNYHLPAVCIDLDGTVWSDDSSHTIFTGVRDTLQLFITRNWSIIFITGRTKNLEDITLRSLDGLLSRNQYSLYMREMNDPRTNILYKQDCRKVIRQTYTIVLSVGDHLCDINAEEDESCLNILMPRVR